MLCIILPSFFVHCMPSFACLFDFVNLHKAFTHTHTHTHTYCCQYSTLNILLSIFYMQYFTTNTLSIIFYGHYFYMIFLWWYFFWIYCLVPWMVESVQHDDHWLAKAGHDALAMHVARHMMFWCGRTRVFSTRPSCSDAFHWAQAVIFWEFMKYLKIGCNILAFFCEVVIFFHEEVIFFHEEVIFHKESMRTPVKRSYFW